MPSVILVHLIDQRGDHWYLALDTDQRPITPVCSTRDELRGAISALCFAVNDIPVEVVKDANQ